MAQILIIDDKADITSLVADVLGDEGHSATEAHNVAQAQEALSVIEYDIIILDIWLEDNKMDGIGLLRIIRKQHPQTPVIMISGHATAETAALAMKIGAYDFIEKPFKADKILFVVRKALEMRNLNDARLITSDSIKDIIVGRSTEMNQVRDKSIKMAKSNARFTIFGSGGSGKRLLAKTIHRLSARRHGRFVCYHPRGKSEAEQLAEVIGTRKQPSLFEMVQHGTLLFKDIHLLPLKVQEAIVDILQRSTISSRDKAIELDVRVIVSSSLSQTMVEQLVDTGKVDKTLYSRVNVEVVTLPDLRDRVEDIPHLISHFIGELEKDLFYGPLDIAQEAVSIMLSYDWPGNVAELQSVLHGLAVLSRYHGIKLIEPSHLPHAILNFNSITYSHKEDLTLYMQKSYREAKKAFEREYILAQIEKFGGNISKTSSFIGLERTALHRKMKDLGITCDGEI